MSESQPSDLEEEARAQLESLALSINDPEALARALGHWLRQKVPERLLEAMWVDLEGNRDRGISVRIYEKPLPRWPAFKARLGGLLGLKSYGLDVSMEVYKTASGAHVSLGIGAVATYQDYTKFKPVASIAVRF